MAALEYHVRPGRPLGWVEAAVRDLCSFNGPLMTWDVVAAVIVCGADAYGMVDADRFSAIETQRGTIPVLYSGLARPDVRSHVYGIDGMGLACIMPLS